MMLAKEQRQTEEELCRRGIYKMTRELIGPTHGSVDSYTHEHVHRETMYHIYGLRNQIAEGTKETRAQLSSVQSVRCLTPPKPIDNSRN